MMLVQRLFKIWFVRSVFGACIYKYFCSCLSVGYFCVHHYSQFYRYGTAEHVHHYVTVDFSQCYHAASL